MVDIKEIARNAGKTSPFPKDPANNQLFFKYPYIFLYRTESICWFPLYSDQMGEIELANMKEFCENEYPHYAGTDALSLDSLADDMRSYLKKVIKPESIEEFCKYIEKASLDGQLNVQS